MKTPAARLAKSAGAKAATLDDCSESGGVFAIAALPAGKATVSEDDAVECGQSGCGRGLEALVPYLAPGKPCVLVGSSGTGKSTIVNYLLGAETLRAYDDRANHQSHADRCPPFFSARRDACP